MQIPCPPAPELCWPGARSPAPDSALAFLYAVGSPGEPGQQPREGQGWAGAGARLTVDSELEVLGLLAGGAEGYALVPPLVAQVAAGDSEQLAVLQELDVRVPGKDRPGKEVRTVRHRSRREQGQPQGRQRG